jgi:hypothetical protein
MKRSAVQRAQVDSVLPADRRRPDAPQRNVLQACGPGQPRRLSGINATGALPCADVPSRRAYQSNTRRARNVIQRFGAPTVPANSW